MTLKVIGVKRLYEKIKIGVETCIVAQIEGLTEWIKLKRDINGLKSIVVELCSCKV